jgi:hypothetical protein
MQSFKELNSTLNVEGVENNMSILVELWWMVSGDIILAAIGSM